MSYVIKPQEVFGVIAATARDHVTLHDDLTQASDRLEAAAGGAPGAPAVVAELGNFRAEHDRLTELQQTRVERAAHGCNQAVLAYHSGDRSMAEAFTRSAAVLYGDPQPSSSANPRFPHPPPGPLPDVLQGG